MMNMANNANMSFEIGRMPRFSSRQLHPFKPIYRCHESRQQGLALAICLVLLVAMTIVGIATLRSTRLNEQVAGNAQQKAISFEVAESAIATSWGVDEFLQSLQLIPNGEFDNPAPVLPPGLAEQLSAGFDQTNSLGVSVDIDAEVTVQYCGEMSRPAGTAASADESKVQLAGVLFDVNGSASIKGSNAHSEHVQRGYIVRPKTGRLATCTLPGS